MHIRKRNLTRYACPTATFFVYLFALYVACANASQASGTSENISSAPSKQSAEAPFTVKLPGGLYLFQGWYGGWDGHFSSVTAEAGRGVEPLFVVEKGKLRDPYTLASRLGVQAFFEKYIRGIAFDTYVGGRPVGKLNGYQLETCKFLLDKTWAPMMHGEGRLEGSKISATVKMEKPKAPEEMWQYYPYPGPKAVFTPGKSIRQASEARVSITPNDLEKLRRLFDEQAANKNEEKGISNKGKPAVERELISIRAMAMDVSGNGAKDLLAVYGYYMGPRNVPRDQRKYLVQAFVLMGSGKLEPITPSRRGGLMPGGLIDLDQDGVQEVILIEDFESEHEPGVIGGRFRIFRREPQGWREVYQTSQFNLDCLEDYTRTYK